MDPHGKLRACHASFDACAPRSRWRFFLSWFLAYLVQPAVSYLQACHLSRTLSLVVVFSMLILGVAVIALLIAPPLVREAIQLSKELPENLPILLDKIEEWLPDLAQKYVGQALDRLREADFDDLAASLAPSVSESAKGMWSIAKQALLLGLTPIFFVYALIDFENIRNQFFRFLPESKRDSAQRYIKELNSQFYNYLRGMFIVGASLAVMYGVGLSLSGIRFGFLIGIVAGILSIVPYLGAVLGFLAALVVTTIYEPSMWKYIGLGMTWTISQSVESYYLTPKLVGKEVGINPLFVILLVIAGANVAGIIGMFVAIPVGSFLWFLLKEVLSSNPSKA